MAMKCGISMDQIFSQPNGMDFLNPALFIPLPRQETIRGRLAYHEVPEALLRATKCPVLPDLDDKDKMETEVEVVEEEDLSLLLGNDRWIWIREIKEGVSKYLLSPGFEENLATMDEVTLTFQQNNHSVMELFVQAEDRHKHTRALAFQYAIHSQPGLPLQSTIISGVNIKTKHAATMVVDQLTCLALVHLDHSVVYQEYIFRGETQQAQQRQRRYEQQQQQAQQQPIMTMMKKPQLEASVGQSVEEEPPPLFGKELLMGGDDEELDDDEVKFVLGLLER
eukprot:CAMPEP_0118700098 /NCGR_PEP_ID=MMETSP0800-20121206/16355_1 /TAXON_ID=210618 ORGANISM="Striatella unipunctata, Strain CCMP2910" /NCGR_SAMPLE_ID=MMETSP0800 /ASSEMBLY_ACC=CAM_ASM_000638 /LENGTH=279 /DNA_ID=CAMNT_0006600567 /DNA_START=60 /DNA_END=903 /DNA_ORIENTATION=-